MTRPTCACRCGDEAEPLADGLCESCWREWCGGSTRHQPIADRSYMGVYGLMGLWTGWLIGQGAGEIVAQPPTYLQRPETPPLCPKCGERMVRRPSTWKCYRHDEPVVMRADIPLPRSPHVGRVIA